MAFHGRLSHAQKGAFVGMLLGGVIAARTTGQARWPLFLLFVIGGIVGALVGSYLKKRQDEQGH